MRQIMVGIALALACGTAAADGADERLAPAFYAGFAFGGTEAAHDPRLGVRLDAPSPLGGTLELARWELRGDAAELALAGQPVMSHSFRVGYGDTQPPATDSRLGWTLLAVAAGVALTAAVVEAAGEAAAESIGESVGQETAETMVEAFGGDPDAEEPPPCEGVEVGENCVGG